MENKLGGQCGFMINYKLYEKADIFTHQHLHASNGTISMLTCVYSQLYKNNVEHP